MYLKNSSRVDKTYMVTLDNKTIHFGAAGMSDYTIHKDDDRKRGILIDIGKHWTTIKESIQNLNENNKTYNFKLS